METLLVLYLVSGAVIREPISPADCRELVGWARYADATGSELVRDGAGPIARLACGGHDIVLQLPPSDGSCEEAAA
jgi:hypothetical protein